MPEHYVDIRFIVTAKDTEEAVGKVHEYLPESSDDIWWTIDSAIPKDIEDMETL